MWVLIPVLIVVVMLASMASLLAGVFWMLGAAWPWLLIALGVWLFFHEHDEGRRGQRRHERRGTGPRAVAGWGAWGSSCSSSVAQRPAVDKRAQPVAAQVAARPARPTELPIDVKVKVEQIRRKVEVLLGYADRFPPFSQDLYLVRQTANDYLPRTIDAYLSLTQETADKPIIAGGKTAHQELKAQLDLLDSKLDDIAQDLERQDTDRLLANRRFLEDRFGMRDVHSAGAEAVAG
jgi:hypothetical protein